MEEILLSITLILTIAIILVIGHVMYISKRWEKEDRINPCLECNKKYSDCKYCKHFYKYGGKLKWS